MKPIRISERGRTSPPSPIRKLVPLAVEARARGIEVFQLNIGQPDLPTPPEMWEALQSAGPILAYSPSEGLHELREAISAYYGSYDLSIDPNEILVTTGASEAILFALGAITDPGDEILIPEPLYANYVGFSHLLGTRVVPVPTRPEDGYHLPPPGAWEERLSSRTRAVLVCNPGNPTGTVYAPEELEQIVEMAQRWRLFIIADEVYREFCYDDLQHRSFMTFPEVHDRIVLIDSVSKRFSACGARIGSLATKNAEVRQAAMHYAQARLSPPSLGQIMATVAFGFAKEYFSELVAEYQSRRDAVIEELHKVDGVICETPTGAFYAMAKLPVRDADRFAAWMLREFDLDGKTTFVAPGNGFYATPGAGTQEVRLAFVLGAEHMREAVRVLAKGIEAYPERLR